MRRELAISLGAPLTWWVAALTSFVVGHSFVLAVDLFAAASRSVAGVGTMTRGLDPLLGVVAPTVGAVTFCLTLLGPVVAARMLAVDRERRTLHAVLLRSGSPGRLLLSKWLVAVLGLLLFLAPAALSLVVWEAIGGHVGAAETAGALLGVLLHVGLLAAWGAAAAAWTRSLSAAVTVTLALSCGSWILDGTAELAVLSWLAPIARLSLSPHLEGLQRGVLLVGDVGWVLVATAASLVVGYVGLRVDASPRARALAVVVVLGATASGLGALDQHDGGWDLSESRRASLPKEVTAALRTVDGPIVLDVWMDRDDARRTHVERDALLRLRLAIDDLVVRFPLDDAADPGTAIRDRDYGLIVVNVGSTRLSTRSTARRELSTLVLEAAGRPVPVWAEEPYAGHGLTLAATARPWVVAFAYLLMPLALAAAGAWLRWRP